MMTLLKLCSDVHQKRKIPSVAEALLSFPPETDDAWPEAVFSSSPETDENLPEAVFSNPPETDE